MTSEPTRSDEQLLESFLTGPASKADAAFRLLVERHGSMVMSTCRQILRGREDAEDASQMTFLALAQKARTIRNRQVLGAWLHAVASRISIGLRAKRARRRLLENVPEEIVSSSPSISGAERQELRLVLHAELDRLPDHQRRLVTHCYLDGKSNLEVARLLGCPLGTVKGRLFRARNVLRQGLRSRGSMFADQFVAAWG
jgi:RNA polymerase sigma factor (sigma-70 family)